MEEKSSFDSFELQFTPIAQGFLRETAKWAKFLSIVGFVVIGLMVLGALAMFALGGSSSQMEGMGGSMGMIGALGAAAGFIYLIIAVLYFFPVLYLYKFATKAINALNGNNTEELTSSLENLKSHYKFIGILMVIMLAFYALIFVIALVAGVGAAAAM